MALDTNYLREGLQAVEEAVREAGVELMRHYGKAEVAQYKTESASDAVTQLDIQTEEHIAKKLSEFDPTVGFRGEEHGTTVAGDRHWLVDPIDGTAHFVRGMPFCTTMVALVDEGEVVMSAIYNFVEDEFYAAIKGQGATCNGKPISVSNRTLKQSYVALEASTSAEGNLGLFHKLRKQCIIMNTINCGYELSMVACGKLDARIAKNSYGMDWDYAPGSLIVREAGGIVANLGTTTYDYTNHDFIAAGPTAFAELTQGEGALFPLA